MRSLSDFSTEASFSAQFLQTSFTVHGDLDVEREPLLDLVFAVGNLLHGASKVRGLGLREKSDVAKVDAEQRNFCLTRDLRSAQQRAVATKDDDGLRPACAVRHVGHDIRGSDGEVDRFALENADVDCSVTKEPGDVTSGGHGFGATGVAHEQHASGHEGPSAIARARSLSSSARGTCT